LPPYLYRAIEEEGQVLLGAFRYAPLSLAEITNQAEVDRVQVIAFADGVCIQVLGEGLARLVVFRQPVTGPRRRQGIGQGA
jgi:hypothetical protein